MANSGIAWVDIIFNGCVIALNETARWFGITYEEINVWLFCIIWPIGTLALMGWSITLWRQNRRFRSQISGNS